MQKHRAIVFGLAIALGVALVAATKAGATPLLAMQAASQCDSCHVAPDRNDPKWVEANYTLAERKCRATCGACHVNPTGGMLRTASGNYFGEKVLPLQAGVAPSLEKGLRLVRENPYLTFGGDFRFMDIITNQEEKKSPFFFPMQGDLYLGSRLGDHVSFLTQFGLERGGNPAVREVFGMVDNLPYNAYVKFGKFMPPFGHRLEDHTVYVRKELLVDHSNPVSYNSGAEIGADALVFYGRVAYFNEDIVPKKNSDTTTSVTSGVLGWQGLWLQLGGSYLQLRDTQNWGEASGIGAEIIGDRTAYGAYGAVDLWRLTWLFEYDWIRNDPAGVREEFDELVTYNELAIKAFRGITAKVRFETLDPDRDRSDDGLTRYGGGLDFYPYPSTEVNVQYRFNDTPAERFGQLLFMIHLWF